MKKYLTLILIFFISIQIFSRDYSFMDPPRIAVMDLEETKNSIGTFSSYINIPSANTLYTDLGVGSAVSNALLTQLIKNDGAGRQLFPAIKVYDKKYIELALKDNNYNVNDLYALKPDVFKVTNIDYVIVGNVYELSVGDGSQYGINLRVLSIGRAEELLSYQLRVKLDLSNLDTACDMFSRRLISDILKNYYSKIRIIKNEIEDSEFRCFIRPKFVRDNEDRIVNSNDTHYESINDKMNKVLELLPGEYELLIYRPKYELKKITVNLNPREYKEIALSASDFEPVAGSKLIISDVYPTDNFRMYITGKSQELFHFWEIDNYKGGKSVETIKTVHEIEFNKEQNYQLGKTVGSVMVQYDSSNNRLIIDKLDPSIYDVEVMPEGSRKSSITGIKEMILTDSRFYKTVNFNLKMNKTVNTSLNDLLIAKKVIDENLMINKVSFILNPAFINQTVEVTINNNTIPLIDIEKLIVSDNISKRDFDSRGENYISYSFKIKGKQPISGVIKKSDINNNPDVVKIIDLTKAPDEVSYKDEDKKVITREEAEKIVSALLNDTSTAKKETKTKTKTKKTKTTSKALKSFFLPLTAMMGVTFNQDPFSSAFVNTNMMMGIDVGLLYALNKYVALGGGLTMGFVLPNFMSSSLATGSGIGLSGGMVMFKLMAGDLANKKVAFVFDIGGAWAFGLKAGVYYNGMTLKMGYLLTYPYGPGAHTLSFDIGYSFNFGKEK
ncbi:MAG: hypothetical protein KA885_06315 [Spirochaetes bacterium]|nr:hypothetical protein [Spirochaetota bacterium]